MFLFKHNNLTDALSFKSYKLFCLLSRTAKIYSADDTRFLTHLLKTCF